MNAYAMTKTIYRKHRGGENVKDKGFSLIEVIIGLLILGVAVISIIGMQIISVRGNFFSRYLTQANYLVQDGLESLDNLPFNSPRLQVGSSYSDGEVTISGIVFNRHYTVANDASNDKIISYTVAWNDGIDRTIGFSTIRSQ